MKPMIAIGTAIVLILMVAVVIFITIPLLTPTNRDECVMSRVHKVQADRAVGLLLTTCERMFPSDNQRPLYLPPE